jgi:Rieske Fe-S protein
MSFIKGKNLEYDKKEDKKDELVSSRRDFVILTASSVAGVGAIAAAVPFVRSLSPDASVLAVSTVEIDISNIKEEIWRKDLNTGENWWVNSLLSVVVIYNPTKSRDKSTRAFETYGSSFSSASKQTPMIPIGCALPSSSREMQHNIAR